MSDIQKSPEGRSVTVNVDAIPAVKSVIVESNNKEVDIIEVPIVQNAPVPEDNIPESNEELSTQPEVEENKRKSEEMETDQAEDVREKKVKLDSPTPELKQNESVEKSATPDMEANSAEIPEVDNVAKTPEVEANPPKMEADMDNPKGDAEVAA